MSAVSVAVHNGCSPSSLSEAGGVPGGYPASRFCIPFCTAGLSDYLSDSIRSSTCVYDSVALFGPEFVVPDGSFTSAATHPLLVSVLGSGLRAIFGGSVVSSKYLGMVFVMLVLFASFYLGNCRVLFAFRLCRDAFFVFGEIGFFVGICFFGWVCRLFSAFFCGRCRVAPGCRVPLRLHLCSINGVPSSSLGALLVCLKSRWPADPTV